MSCQYIPNNNNNLCKRWTNFSNFVTILDSLEVCFLVNYANCDLQYLSIIFRFSSSTSCQPRYAVHLFKPSTGWLSHSTGKCNEWMSDRQSGELKQIINKCDISLFYMDKPVTDCSSATGEYHQHLANKWHQRLNSAALPGHLLLAFWCPLPAV